MADVEARYPWYGPDTSSDRGEAEGPVSRRAANAQDVMGTWRYVQTLTRCFEPFGPDATAEVVAAGVKEALDSMRYILVLAYEPQHYVWPVLRWAHEAADIDIASDLDDRLYCWSELYDDRRIRKHLPALLAASITARGSGLEYPFDFLKREYGRIS